MTLPKLQMFCSCNCPVSPTVLALTPDKKLLCVSHCPNCGQETQTAFPLSELEAHCPKPELTAETLATAIDEAVEGQRKPTLMGSPHSTTRCSRRPRLRLNKHLYYYCKLNKRPNMGKIRHCCVKCPHLGSRPKLVQLEGVCTAKSAT